MYFSLGSKMPLIWRSKDGLVHGSASDGEKDPRVQDLAVDESSKVAGCSVKKFKEKTDEQAIKAVYRGCQRRAEAIPDVSNYLKD